MSIIEIIILIAASIFTFVWILGIRRFIVSGQGITRQTINTAMLFIVSIALVFILRFSSFNLLWMFPLSWVLGTFSLAFPFSLLWIFGRYFALIFVIGLSQNKKK